MNYDYNTGLGNDMAGEAGGTDPPLPIVNLNRNHQSQAPFILSRLTNK